MLLIARRTALAAALLLVMPLTVWLSGWLWQPGLPVAMLKSLWWVTETVTQPWGIITHVVLCGWFLWCLRFRLRAALILFLILAAAILAGQGAKSWVKARVQEPRPFVIWLENTRQVPVTQFYALKRKERAKLVHEQLAQAQDIPSFLRKHWQKETGFAFPSGHTMFAASWALLAAGLLWPRRRWGTIAVLLVVGDGGDGQSPGAGHALAAGSHRRHADLLAAGHGGLLADAAPLWAALAARRRGAGY
ncbi:phosphatidylglycerophosphatase B [Klebsiella pneumoniae]|uniref:Phosphatidylglycerophosphatase B n=1 Tax=Klebsiella pneumoniae TaxID=573 RepID=A0A377TVG3_KLEPN|nr:phosphatidylglycerophosphatase B [Klebsiella pneumoniae]